MTSVRSMYVGCPSCDAELVAVVTGKNREVALHAEANCPRCKEVYLDSDNVTLCGACDSIVNYFAQGDSADLKYEDVISEAEAFTQELKAARAREVDTYAEQKFQDAKQALMEKAQERPLQSINGLLNAKQCLNCCSELVEREGQWCLYCAQEEVSSSYKWGYTWDYPAPPEESCVKCNLSRSGRATSPDDDLCKTCYDIEKEMQYRAEKDFQEVEGARRLQEATMESLHHDIKKDVVQVMDSFSELFNTIRKVWKNASQA